MTNTHRTLTILAAVILAVAARARADSFAITLDTSPLSGTQTLAFGLTDGNGSSNEVTLTGFTFGGGSASAGTADCTLGGALSGLGCSGDLASGVTLQDLDFLVFFSQQFDPGSALSFVLTTTNDFGGGIPDQFAMYVCDGGFVACYSDDGATGAMLLLDLVGGSLSPSSFVVVGASDQNLPPPVVRAVPEPATLVLVAGGLLGTAVQRRRNKFLLR